MNGRDAQDLPLAQPLTPREEEVLALIGEGKTNRQIAEALTIAMSTVKWYVRQVYNKLGVDNRTEAIARARSLGLLAAEEQEGAIRQNLPVAATPFVGREVELASMAEFIADPHARIITLTGPGGIGKTRLALQAAGRELHPACQFPDGIFFVSLAPLESAAEIVTTLATVLDFHFQGSANESEQLLNYLRQKKMLLVMDNIEHILDGRALLAEINEQVAEITLIVTSRERLQMRGEQLFPLGGLEMAQTADSAKESPSAKLFLNIARRTVPDFELLEGDAEHLLHICRLVEGMPLGLELAASWVGLLPLSEIAAEIEQSLHLLATEQGDVPQRHKSMEAALDTSWRRLTSEQQRAFQELTVFRGGFTRMAAVEVTGATLPLLVTLANKSWLSYDRQNDRYHIHELLRQYGAGKLSSEPAHKQEVRERHSAFFCTYLQEREIDWFGPRQKEAAAEIRDEIDNIQRTWRWAANKGDVVRVAQGLNSLCRFYLWEGRMTDGRHACRSASDGLSNRKIEQQAGDPDYLTTWSMVLAWESRFVNEGEQKEKLLLQSEHLLDRLKLTSRDTKREQAFVLIQKAESAVYTDPYESIRLANQGLTLSQELGDRWGEAEALEMIGDACIFLGAYDQANDSLRDSLAIRQQLGDTQGIVGIMFSLGMTARHQGNFAEAETLQRQGLELFKQSGSRYREWEYLGTLSFTLSWAGKNTAARETVRQAMERDPGQVSLPFHLNSLTRATIHLGYYHEAHALATESLAVARQRDINMVTGFALMYLGNIAFVNGDLDGANRHLLESLSVLVEMGHVNQTLPRAHLSYLARAQGDGRLAREHLVETLRMVIKDRSISSIMYCLPLAALLAAEEGRNERAVELYGLAQQFGHIRNSRWFADVACNELDEVRASLPADVAAAAETRGREMDVWETAEALLRELDGT